MPNQLNNKKLSDAIENEKTSLESRGQMILDATTYALNAAVISRFGVLKLAYKDIENSPKYKNKNTTSLIDHFFPKTINDASVRKNATIGDALIMAVQKGLTQAIQYLMAYGADKDHCDENGSTALINSVKNKNERMIKLLIETGANKDAVDSSCWTALMHAIHQDSINPVRDKNSIIINSITSNEIEINTAKIMIAACNDKDFKILKKDINIANASGHTALMFAAINGRKDLVDLLLKNGANKDAVTEKGWTALMLASINGSQDLIDLLLKNGANKEAVNTNGFTALMLASFRGNYHTAAYLVEKNANIETATKEGWTALMLAAQNGHSDIVAHLIKNGAEIDAVDERGCTALIVSSQNGHEKTVECLVERGAKIDAASNRGFTALMVAGENDHKKIVAHLVEKGATINQATKEGQTALMLSAKKGHFNIVDYLLKHSADIEATTNDGFTALMHAAIRGNLHIVQHLVYEGAKTDPTIKAGLTALALAEQNRQKWVVDFLKKNIASKQASDNSNEKIASSFQEKSSASIAATDNFGTEGKRALMPLSHEEQAAQDGDDQATFYPAKKPCGKESFDDDRNPLVQLAATARNAGTDSHGVDDQDLHCMQNSNPIETGDNGARQETLTTTEVEFIGSKNESQTDCC